MRARRDARASSSALRPMRHLEERLVEVRPPIAEELPLRTHLLDDIEIQIGDYELLALAPRFRQDLAAGIGEIARSVEVPEVPRRLRPDAVVRADEVSVRDGVCRLLELPEV